MKLFKFTWLNFQSAIFLLIISMFLISCSRGIQEKNQSLASGTPVRLVHPQVLDFTESIDLNANTIYLTKEMVRATFPGFIENIFKNIGDDVKIGELLLLIKTKESAADDNLKIHLGNDIFKGSVAIRARTDGVLTTLNYSVGDFVSEGEQIAIVANPNSLAITLNVPYAYVARMNHQTQCELFLPDGKSLRAFVHKFIPSVDPVSQTQTVLLHIDNSVRLPENLNLNARMHIRTITEAVGLPKSAVMSDEKQEIFWIMKLLNDSTAIRIDIQKGIENDSLVQIASPVLLQQDRIVSEGSYGLPDTAKVLIGQ